MKNRNLISVALGKDKSFWPTSIMVWSIFVFGVIIIYVIPNSILENYGSYAITNTVKNFVKCSNIKLEVAAFYNFMFLYSFMIGFVMGMTAKFNHENMEKFERWIYLIIPMLIISIFWVYTGMEPSCVADNPGRSARTADSLIKSPIHLLIFGGLLTGGISMFIGMTIGAMKFIIKSKG